MNISAFFAFLLPATVTGIKRDSKLRSRKDVDRHADDIRKVNKALLPLLFVAVLACAWIGWRSDSLGPIFLWAVASLTAGGTVGFLFGIPKVSSTDRGAPAEGSTPASPGAQSGERVSASRARPNTNLEEISDWVTKIIVGLALINFKEIGEQLSVMSRRVAVALSATPSEAQASAATALLLGFFLIGLLCAYLYTRLFLQGAFVRSDDQMAEYRKAIANAQEVALAEVPPEPASSEPTIPSAATKSAAQQVADVAPSNDPALVLQPLRNLAAEYERLRNSMPAFSNERTRLMSDIVAKMRPHAIAAAPYVEMFATSSSPGERLVAVVILQMKFMPQYIDWLAERLVMERSFIGYQAASALLARARNVGKQEAATIVEAVSRAKEQRIKQGISEERLDRLVEQIVDVA